MSPANISGFCAAIAPDSAAAVLNLMFAHHIMADIAGPDYRQEYAFECSIPSDARCTRQREGWPAGENPPRARWRVEKGESA